MYMAEQEKMDFNQLEEGYEFPVARYTVDASMVATYMGAVDETNSIYSTEGLVPPMAVLMYAMSALSENISLPPGAIHFYQEMESLYEVHINEQIESHAEVSRKQDRGRLHVLTVDLSVLNQDRRPVMLGKTGFVLPQDQE
jgi:hypothetical protein